MVMGGIAADGLIFLLFTYSRSSVAEGKMHTDHDPTLNYMGYTVDFSEHDNTKIKREVLPRTAKKYSRTLVLFDA
jgi:hypothetical protein